MVWLDLAAGQKSRTRPLSQSRYARRLTVNVRLTQHAPCMTAQINDRVFHRKIRYSLAGVSGNGLFDPASYGVKPQMLSTACYKGFHVDYEVTDSMLQMTSLTIGLTPEQRLQAERGELPFAPGAVPAIDRIGQPTLEGLSLPISFSGGLLLADGLLRGLYVHLDSHTTWKFTDIVWKYADVRELIPEQGRITEDHDRSQQMADIRGRLKREPWQPISCRSAEVPGWIERSFSLDYSR